MILKSISSTSATVATVGNTSSRRFVVGSDGIQSLDFNPELGFIEIVKGGALYLTTAHGWLLEPGEQLHNVVAKEEPRRRGRPPKIEPDQA